MSDPKKLQAEVFMELQDMLTPQMIRTLGNAVNVPARIMENAETNPIKFLFRLKEWDQFDPTLFDLALQQISGRMLHSARKLQWLSSPQRSHTPSRIQTRSVGSFVQLLTDELTSQQWMVLANTSEEKETKSMLRECVNSKLISKDTSDLCEFLKIVKRNDLAEKVRSYAPEFQKMSKETFEMQLHREISLEDIDNNADLDICLKRYMKTHNKDINVVLGEGSVPIESVYTPLTVIKVKPAEERVKEESGINEIDFLRLIHKRVSHKTVKVVDFESIVTTSPSSENPIWCLIGNPGSGKSFLCNHFAHLYGIHSLNNFSYALSIPCRSKEWHKLEEARHEAGNPVDEEFIVSWLALSMSFGAKWTKSLTQHLLRSDGDGLFIILDGVDEFTRNVPFETTLLCKILERRFLAFSTILVTSRPSAWSDLSFNYGAQFKISANFQVLGFSPKNRDRYFAKRMASVDKLNAVFKMFFRHEEIKQLALVPVNASLFTSLFNNSNSILATTLSHIYTQLVVYIIRRQLSRMGLDEHSDVRELSRFHPGIRKCIRAIGKEANQGLFDRDLTSDKNIPLKIGDAILNSERLGLMHAHIKVVGFSHRVKVWTFQHLTIQEFMTALSICANSWTNQCFIVRYISSSVQYLSIYKMVIRFVSGILRQNAGRITPILCRHVIPKSLCLSEVPTIYQLRYFTELVDLSGWTEFTKSFMLLSTLISEMKCDSICEHFAYFKKQFPHPLYLDLRFIVSPNEWHCFIQSFRFVNEFHVIFINASFITSIQFNSLLAALSSCHLDYLALVFVKKDFKTILSFTFPLSSAPLPDSTRISIELISCDLTACNASQLLFPSTNQFIGSLSLHESPMNHSMLLNLNNQFRSLHNLYYSPKSNDSDWSVINQLITNNPLNGLYIRDFHGYLPVTPDILSALSSLKELYWKTNQDCYEALQYLHRLSSITYLSLHSASYHSPNPSYPDSITRLISENATSLREISLDCLENIGFDSWSRCFGLVSICSNLITLQLTFCNFAPDDMSCWYRALTVMKSLVYLKLVYTPLQNSGMLVLCHSLNYHPAIRYLWIERCELSSDSCLPLKYLILTPPHIKILKLSKSELSNPYPEQLQLLEQSAEQCSIKIKWQY